MIPDDDHCYRILRARDRRFDGWFIVGVRTTGIYCRPSCPATTPRRSNAEFFASAAAAQLGGYRACKRCRPDATPGSPEWDHRADLVGRAVRLVADGVVDREGVRGLARRLGYSERQIHRLLVAELGAPPLALARSQRAQNARVLIETTTLPMVDVAFAAGFSSLRQFNDTVRSVFATTPTDLRRAALRRTGTPGSAGSAGPSTRTGGAGGAVTLSLRLPFRPPFAARSLWAFLAARSVRDVEHSAGSVPDGPDAVRYVRALRLPRGHGVIELSPGPVGVGAVLRLADLRDLSAAVARARRLLDLDADPVAVDASLAGDPILAPLVGARPGLRCAGAVDSFEMAVRAILGQQVSVAASVARVTELAARFGEPLSFGHGDVSRVFPSPEVVAAIEPDVVKAPLGRARALVEVARRCVAGRIDLDPGADRLRTRAELLDVAGVGPWTADYIALRALGDPDVVMSSDLVVRREWAVRGGDPARLGRGSGAWSPWGSTVAHHLWAANTDRGAPANDMNREDP